MTPGISAATSALQALLRATFFAVSLAAAGATCAQSFPDTGPIEWRQLSPAQRSVLGQLEPDWHTISPSQQQKWAEVAKRFPGLPVDERGRIQQRMAEWSRLSPQERATARLNFQETRQLSPREREQQWQTYRALPAEQRRALAERASRAKPAAPAATGPADTKSSVVRSPAAAAPQPVGPTVVQRGSGATTSLVSKPATPPLHQQAGLPKVTATPGFVDSETLLPQRGAQGAAARPRKGGDGDGDDKPKAR